MTEPRYVVAGLAHVRSSWFTDVARWSTLEALPIEFLKCLSASELRARLQGGRALSAVLVDLDLSSVDVDLLDEVQRRAVPVIVVTDGLDRHPWMAGRAVDVLPPGFDRVQLLDLLASCAERIEDPADDQSVEDSLSAADPRGRSPLIAVTGSPGAGTSTVAVAIAQGLATQRTSEGAGTHGEVVLADLALHAHQALLHDAGDVIPGLAELLDGQRSGRRHQAEGGPDRSLGADTVAVPERGYRLLLGLRRHRDWVGVRQRALRVALHRLRCEASAVVADITGDFEGEATTGSFDVEDRNLLARVAAAEATVVVVVGSATLTGLHATVSLLDELRDLGVAASRIVVVFNRAPQRPRARAELTRALANLVARADDHEWLYGPVFLAERRGMHLVHVRASRVPSGFVAPLQAAVGEMIRTAPRVEAPLPQRVGGNELSGGR